MVYSVPYCGKSTEDPSRFERYVRPARFTLNTKHPLAQGLVFAGLGGQGLRLHDYSGNGNHGALVNMEETDWVDAAPIGRRGIQPDGTTAEYAQLPAATAVGNASAKTISFWMSGLVYNSTSYGLFYEYLNSGNHLIINRSSWTYGPQIIISNNYGTVVTLSNSSSGVNETTSTSKLYHVAFVSNGITDHKLYLNGNLIDSDTGTITLFSATTYPRVGYHYDGGMSGIIADPMIYNRALSAEEIKRLADPKNVLLDDMLVPEPDRSITQRRVAVVRGHSFEKVKQRPEQFELDLDHPLAKGLVFAGLGNKPGSTRYHDSSVFGNTGTLTNMDPATDWVFSPALNRFVLDIDGANDYINLPSTTLLNGTLLTVSAWVWWISAGTTYPRVLDRVYNGQFSCYIDENDRSLGMAVNTSGGATDATNLTGENTVPASNTAWAHLAWQYNGDKIIGWINGVKATPFEAANGVLASSTSAMRIGERMDGTGRLFEGMIGDLLVHNRLVSDSEMVSIADPSNVMLSGLIKPLQGTTKYFRGVTLSDAYTLKPPAVHVSHGVSRPQNFTLDYSHPLAKGLVFAGLGNAPGSTRFNDSSAYKNHGTCATSNATYPVTHKHDSYLNRRCVGLQQVLYNWGNTLTLVGTPTPATHKTYACWVKGRCNVFFGAVSGNYANNYGWGITSAAANEVSVVCGDGTTAVYDALKTSIDFSIWNHLCVTVTGSGAGQTFIFYKNGLPVSTYTGTATFTYGYGFRFGSNSYDVAGSFTYSGSDMCAWNRVLSASEVALLADPSNAMLSGLIVPQDTTTRILPLAINDRHWVGCTSDWHSADNWSRSQGGRGGAGVPNENTNVFFD